jgi:hypothetical protein
MGVISIKSDTLFVFSTRDIIIKTRHDINLVVAIWIDKYFLKWYTKGQRQ